MRTFLLPLFAVAIAPFAAAADTAPTTPAATTAEAAPVAARQVQAGDPAPTALLPSAWVRGEPVKALSPGVTYVFVAWNTNGGHGFAPGYNIARPLKEFQGNPAVQGVVVLIQEKLPPEKLAKRLALPSQQTPFPIAHATPGSESEKAFLNLIESGPKTKYAGTNSVIIRDGRILWLGEATDISDDQLRPFLKPDFNYDAHVKWSTAYQARTRELVKLLMQELPAAEKAKDTAKVQEILRTVETEPELHPFVFSRLCDARCGIAMEKGDLPGAVAAMRVLSDKYPESEAAQAWVHKVIVQTDELYQPGLGLASLAAERMAKRKDGDSAVAWWRAVAKYRRELGDQPGALVALEAAQKESPTYRRLQAMKSGTR